MRYSPISRVRVWIAPVTASGAGPPLATLYFIPKSPSGPPGLWLADRMIPPSAPRWRIRFEAAGVDKSPPCPTITRAAPLAAAIFRMICTALSLKNRPSPPST
jgi:hypothetical protein